MGPLSAAAALQLPVRLHGIRLGRPVDLLVDATSWRATGFVVRCGDESQRFLPYAASQPSETEIAVGSALLLLEDVGFYRRRGVSFRSLLGGGVERGRRPAGSLRDLVLGPGGAILELELERGGTTHRIPAAGAVVVPTRATAA
ncbi:MAG: hypothetical protein ACYDCH_07610 [Gaiellaceae bacterium]